MSAASKNRALARQIRQVNDPEVRARLMREWGVIPIGLDHASISGSGPESALARAIFGHDVESFLGGDRDGLVEAASFAAEQARIESYLARQQVTALFDAASFLVQEYGLLLNAQFTVVYALLGIHDEGEATELLSELLREAGMRLSDWKAPLHWMYVHERTEEFGFHTHIVAHVDVACRTALTRWITGRFLTRRFGAAVAHGPAVKIQISGRRMREAQVALHGHRLRYICKGLDPELMDRDEDGSRRPLIDLLGIEEKFRRAAGPLGSAQRYRVSESIGPSARAAAASGGLGMLSPFRDKAWSWLYKGWELDEHGDRMREKDLRRTLARVSNIADMPTPSEPEDPTDRYRSWRGWWPVR